MAGRTQNLLINGSFELPTLSSNGMTISAGSTNLTGWTLQTNRSSYRLYLIRGPVLGSSGSFFSAADGAQYVDLNPGLVISQSIPTVPGEIYAARFRVGLYQGSNVRMLAAILDNTGLVLTNVEVAPPPMQGWNPPTILQFTATTERSVLRFAETNSTGNYDLTLDDVSVDLISPRIMIEYSHVRVCWYSRTNTSYQLQYRSDLTTSMWSDLGAPILGTNGVSCVIEPLSDPRRFYRVIIAP